MALGDQNGFLLSAERVPRAEDLRHEKQGHVESIAPEAQDLLLEK